MNRLSIMTTMDKYRGVSLARGRFNANLEIDWKPHETKTAPEK
jgi:hypothetical protein